MKSFDTHYFWHLEATANLPLKPFPVAKLSTKVLARPWSIGPTPNWNGICVFTAWGLSNNLTYEYLSKLLGTLLISIFSSQTQTVSYEIYPDSHIPHFRQVGVLVVSGIPTEALLLAHIIALHHSSSTADHGSRLSVWNYALNMGVVGPLTQAYVL